MRKIELLAPGGDVDSIKAAIAAGADAIYCGINKFNARNRASNISFEELIGVLRLAHKHACKVFLTLNILITEQELPDLTRLLNRLVNTSIDGIIIQDLGLFHMLSNYFPSLEIHASTQLTTHNEGQVKFLKKLAATRVNLSRELNINEIKALTRVAHKEGLLSEVFVHGSYCISFSGLCYMSSVQGGNSGNRGRCSQPCRDQYELTPAGKHYPLNLKDNAAWADLKELSEAGADSLKIEGRIKKYHYVYTVVDAYRKQLQKLCQGKELRRDMLSLGKTFNRGFSNGFLKGDINKSMFTENPRDKSTTSPDEFAEIRSEIKTRIGHLSIDKSPLKITISGRPGSPLRVSIVTPDSSFECLSEKKLSDRGKYALNEQEVVKRFKAINETAYYIEELTLDKLPPGLYLPFSELTLLKKRILFFLNGTRTAVTPVKLPALTGVQKRSVPPTLSVLISSREDLQLLDKTSTALCFELPEATSDSLEQWIELFRKKPNLIPWFPSILIDKEFQAAVNFLAEVRPKRIVTNNSGIALEASEMGILWVAGPLFNLTNSYSLLALKEHFNCAGAFISNELGQRQIRGIKKPENFELYFSIYHPVELMTSRQCFFQQTSGCEKKVVDESCLLNCQKSTIIKNLNKETLYIQKEKGKHNRIYNDTNYLNTDIAKDLPDLFTGFFVELRNIQTSTKAETGISTLIQLFENNLQGIPHSEEQLRNAIHPSNCKQYLRGI